MTDRELLRHFLAALAYRANKAVQGAPEEFAAFRAAGGVRTPQQLIHHMSGVLSYALSHFEALDPWIGPCDNFAEEVTRFHETLRRLGEHLESGSAFSGTTPEQLLQGPLSDAMTHAGQLAMLRRMCGSPIPPENFHEAAISMQNLTAEQPAPRSPDEKWLDAEGRPQD
ncbi:MAG: hypothetical protein V3T86_10470 [Planctomycetota bacterium]